jgi:hypothetical protein
VDSFLPLHSPSSRSPLLVKRQAEKRRVHASLPFSRAETTPNICYTLPQPPPALCFPATFCLPSSELGSLPAYFGHALTTTHQLASPANKRQNAGDKRLTPKRTPRCGGAGVLEHRLTLLLLLEGRHEEVVATVVLLGVGIGG